MSPEEEALKRFVEEDDINVRKSKKVTKKTGVKKKNKKSKKGEDEEKLT